MKRKDMKRRLRPGALLGVALALALGALVLAGCGGSSSGSSSESSTTASAAGSEGSGSEAPTSGPQGGVSISEEAKACLKEKGVELPEFNGGQGAGPPAAGEKPEGGELPQGGPPTGTKSGAPGGEGNEKMQKAFEECGVEMPEFKGGPGGEGGGPSTNSAAFKKQVEKYVACVKENGYELSDPNFSGEGPVFKKSESESSAFKQASAKCESLLGAPASGSSPPSTAGA